MNTTGPSKAAGAACCPACGSTPAIPNETALAIACTLGVGDFRERVARIREMARRSLRRSGRKGLVLHLAYDRGALTEVEDLVASESDCCQFLAFDLRHDAEGVYLTIAAPEAAADAADELFAHFAPELAREDR